MNKKTEEEIIDQTLEHTLAFMNVLVVKLEANLKVKLKNMDRGGLPDWVGDYEAGYNEALAVVEEFVKTGKNVASLMKDRHMELLNMATAMENLEGEVLAGKKKKD